VLPTTPTTRTSGQVDGITLTEDEQAAAQLYALRSILQESAGAIPPLTAQQQAAVYAAGGGGGGGGGGIVFNSPTSLVNRRTPAADDGQCQQPRWSSATPEAPLSQRSCAMLRVIEYYAKSLKSLEISLFDRSHTSSYRRPTVNMALSCIMSEIKRDIGSKIAIFSYPCISYCIPFRRSSS